MFNPLASGLSYFLEKEWDCCIKDMKNVSTSWNNKIDPYIYLFHIMDCYC